MKIYLTWPLAEAIYEGELISFTESTVTYYRGGCKCSEMGVKEGEGWHGDRAAAVARMKQIIQDRIERAREEIHKLQSLDIK